MPRLFVVIFVVVFCITVLFAYAVFLHMIRRKNTRSAHGTALEAKHCDSDDGCQSSDGPICPNCGYQFVVDDSGYYDRVNYTEDECAACGEAFVVEVQHHTSWTTRKRRRSSVKPRDSGESV